MLLVSAVQQSESDTQIRISTLLLLHTHFAALLQSTALRPLENTLPNWVESCNCLEIYIPPFLPNQPLSSDWSTGVWKAQPCCHRWGPPGGLVHSPEFPQDQAGASPPLQDFAMITLWLLFLSLLHCSPLPSQCRSTPLRCHWNPNPHIRRLFLESLT